MKIRITRTSVCAGDSATAPNEAYLEYEPEQTLPSLLKEVIDYLPRISDMSDVMWIIVDKGTGKTLAFVTYDSSNIPVVDIVSDVAPTEIFCRYYCRYMFKDKYPDNMSMSEIKDKLLMDIVGSTSKISQKNKK